MYNIEVLLVGLRNVKDDCGDKGLPGGSCCPVMHLYARAGILLPGIVRYFFWWWGYMCLCVVGLEGEGEGGHDVVLVVVIGSFERG